MAADWHTIKDTDCAQSIKRTPNNRNGPWWHRWKSIFSVSAPPYWGGTPGIPTRLPTYETNQACHVKKPLFIQFVGPISTTAEERGKERGNNERRPSMSHGWSLFLPKESISRTLLNVYNMETFTSPSHPHSVCCWLQLENSDGCLCVLFLPSRISTLLFLEALAVSNRAEKSNTLVANPFFCT